MGETSGGVTITAPEARVITAMVTPFQEDGRLNRTGAQELASYLVRHGSDGLVLAGTTGESPVLTAEDQIDLFSVVREAVGNEVLLIGGTGSNSTAEAIELSATADEEGDVNALLVVSPYYNRPSQYGIERYYEAIADVTDLPILLYNIPVRTGRAVGHETIRRLIESEAVQGVKDATGNTEMAAELHDEFGDDITIYSGDDSLNLEFAREGAVGAISVASHWTGSIMRAMFDAHFAGDSARAAQLQTILAPSVEFESVHTDAMGYEHDTPNPVPTKVMMNQILGAHVIGGCLSPMLVSPEEMQYLETRAAQIREELAEVKAAVR